MFVDTIVDLNGTSPYEWNDWLSVRVTVRNSGGVDALSGTVEMFFSTTGISATPITANTGLTITPAGSVTVDFNVSIVDAIGAVIIDANFTGT